MPPSKKEKIICFACKKPISGARTVIEAQWHCGDCTYLLDHPEAEIKPPRRTRVRKQDETLFPLPPPERRLG